MDPAEQQPLLSKTSRFWTSFRDGSGPAKVLDFLLRPRPRWILCWFVLLAAAGFALQQSWKSFDYPERLDGNNGHAMIDFGGQWLMGRMIVTGQARNLYNRNYQRAIIEKGYPRGVEAPDASKTDAELLMDWLAGTDDPEAPHVLASFVVPLGATNVMEASTLLANAQNTWTEDRLGHITTPRVGGALYPPVHAFYYAPLALLEPRIGYRVMQGILLVLVFFTGWVIERMTEGRVWWPLASLFVMVFPGFSGCIALGQNGMLSFTVVLVGWWQLLRGRQVLAGLCWGLLAFKPVWAASFFLVPMLTGRWRMALSMACAGLVQIALTLPIVGWHGWLNWLEIGREATEEYKRQENWIYLSRDFLGLPRRWMLTFDAGLAQDVVWHSAASSAAKGNTGEAIVWPHTASTSPESSTRKPWDDPLVSAIGWAPLLLVAILTVFVVWRRWGLRNETTGPFPAFVLSASVLTCFHYMYYDFIVAALPMLLLFTTPSRYLQVHFCRSPLWCHKAIATREGRRAFFAAMRAYYQPGWADLFPPPLPLLPGGRRARWVRAPLPPLLLLLMIAVPAYTNVRDPSYRSPPWETFLLLLFWMWCGYRVLRSRTREGVVDEAGLTFSPEGARPENLSTPKFAQFGTDVGSTHEGLADQYGADAGSL